jgi:hypothetical protein
MEVSAWRNGQHSANTMYGLTIPRSARDRFFDWSWWEVIVILPNGDEATASLRPTFWATCSELRGAGIGRWLRSEGLAPWPKGAPPRFELMPLGENRFDVSRPDALS